MGTCITIYSTTTRRESQIQQRYIDTKISQKIQRELNSKEVTTNDRDLQIQDVFSSNILPKSTPSKSDDMLFEMELQVQKFDKMKSTKGNKSRFYHEKQNGESTLYEESINLQVIQFQSDMGSSIVSSKKKRKSKRRESNQSCQLSETTQESIRENTKRNVNYNSYSKDPSCIYGQKLPMLISEGLKSQDAYIMSIAEKYTVPTLVIQEVSFKDQSVYIGEWMSGMKHGNGVLTWEGNKYQGEFKFNQFWGKATITFKNNIIYKGQMKQNAAFGEGELKIPDGSYYKGFWENNKQHGYGILYWSKKEKYEGEWVSGAKHGEGNLTFQDGSYFKGRFVLNQIHGQGQYHYSNKMTYIGEWQHNQKSGNGSLCFVNGDIYKGGFSHDKMHGAGIYVDAEGRQFEGEWINGKRQGIFICSFPEGGKTKSEWYYGKQIRIVDECEQSLRPTFKKK